MQTEKEVGRQHQRMDRPGVRQVPDSSGEHRKMEETGCEIICGAPTPPAVKGQVKVKAKVSGIRADRAPSPASPRYVPTSFRAENHVTLLNGQWV